MKGKGLTIGALALALLGGCAAQKPATYEQREQLYDKIMKDDGTSLVEAKLATRMYFDALNDRLTKGYQDEQKATMATWQDPLMKKIRDFCEADGEATIFAQIQEGKGKNAVKKSIGGREMISLGTLKEFKKDVEDFYKSNQAKIDEVLRGVIRVAQPKYRPVRVHRNRQYNREDFESKFMPIEMGLFNYILGKNNGRIGKEENPGAQINKGDGNFVRAAVGAIVYKGTEIEVPDKPDKPEKAEKPEEKNPPGPGYEWGF